MEIPYYQVNAFTQSVTGGNPAGVCLLEQWLPDTDLQQIAVQNDLAETAYIIRKEDGYELRWFTPTVEVPLCGHATLASAYVVFTYLQTDLQQVVFSSKSGSLTVRRQGGKLELNFPQLPAQPVFSSDLLTKALGMQAQQVLASQRDLMAVLDSEQAVRELKPDLRTIAQIDQTAVMVTAKGENCDFVSRFFAPRAGIPEDPVTGSSFCTLAPYWADRLNKSELHARQLSLRGGEIWCEPADDRVKIAGHAMIYLQGTIHWIG